MTIIWCMVPEIWSMTDKICHFGLFCPFTPLTTQKIKNLKKWIRHLEISSFYICVPKIMIRWCMVPETGARRMGGQTDGWKKWYIEVGAPPKNDTVVFLSFSSCVCNAISYVNVHFRSKPCFCFSSMSS